MAGGEEDGLARRWARYIEGRERATFGVTTLLICVLVPLWSAFDFYLEPAVAGEFLVLRLADVVVTLALWLFISRSSSVRASRGAMMISAIAVGVTIAAMLPQIEHYLLYVLGFSLVFWGCGLILLWPTRYLVTTCAIIVAAHLGLLAVFHAQVSPRDFFGALFYLVSVSAIATAQLVVRRRLEYQAFQASYALEQRNSELAESVRALRSTQAQLAASSALLGDSLDADATGQHVTGVVVPSVAEWVALIGAGPRGTRTSAVAHVDALRREQLAAAVARATEHPSSPSRTTLHAAATPELVARVLGIDVTEVVPTRWLVATPLIVRGKPTGVLVLGRNDRDFQAGELAFADDVAHRAALALENARLFRASEDAVRLREDLISIAGHELRNPLGAQVLTLASLLASTPPHDASRPMLSRLEGQVARLTEQVDQLLDLSQLAAGRLVFTPEDVDLAGLLREVVDRFVESAERAGSPIRLVVPTSLHGQWDRARLEQVLSNLIANGIKYGRGQPLEVTLEGTADRARLYVRDRGIGIAESDRARIFQRFERAVSPRQYGGYGIGLWLVQTIVEAMGGTVRVDSELGRGSTFSVEVPTTPTTS